ncbi:MAG: DoxX family protein [Crocinitomicaceae bacterium]|nr:DoxX family protein [Crocinitomicaceae bacterium]
MKKTNLIIYWIVTGLFCLSAVAGAIAYFAMYDMTSEMFTSLGVPTEVIYPLAIAKILGVIAICFIKSPLLKKLAYLGFALDLIMAIIAHINAGDGEFYGPIIPLALLATSYIFYRKLNAKTAN